MPSFNPFQFISKYSTTRDSDYLWGALPGFAALATLVALGAAFAVVPMLWTGGLWQLSTFMGYSAYSTLAVASYATYRYWFAHELAYIENGCSDLNPDEIHDLDHEPIDPTRMVNHLRQELNALDGTLDETHPNHLP